MSLKMNEIVFFNFINGEKTVYRMIKTVSLDCVASLVVDRMTREGKEKLPTILKSIDSLMDYVENVLFMKGVIYPFTVEDDKNNVEFSQQTPKEIDFNKILTLLGKRLPTTYKKIAIKNIPAFQ